MANYGTVSGADAYHLDAGNAAWTGSDADKLAALTRASAYVDSLALRKRKNGNVCTMFGGTKLGGRDQVLAWPRIGAIDVDGLEVPSSNVPFEGIYDLFAIRVILKGIPPNEKDKEKEFSDVVNCFQNCILAYNSQHLRDFVSVPECCELLSKLYFSL